MRAIMVNGQDSGIKADGLPNMADLIELLKSSIDPDHMITSILIDGRELDDSDWSASTAKYSAAVLEIQTGLPDEYARRKLSSASGVVRQCFLDFREARKCFQAGDMQPGNQHMVRAVNTLQAFFQWYVSMVELLPKAEQPSYSIQDKVTEITETCKKICEQQLYQSWWALGETIKDKLEPQLDKLEDFCREFGKRM
jgi:hypothetical protein